MFALRRFAPSFSASSARAFSSSPSSQLCKVMLIGRLARPVEIKTSSKGDEYLSYAIASKDSKRADSTTSFYEISKFTLTESLRSMMLSLPKGTLMHVLADASHSKRDGGPPRLLLIHRDFEVLSKPRPKEEGFGQEGYGQEQQNGEQY